MKAPSLQKAAALSAVLHVTAFLLSILVFRQTNNGIMPSPYIVSLVVSSRNDDGKRGESEHQETGLEKPATAIDKSLEKDQKDSRTEQKRIDEMIAAIAAKKNIARRVKLRNTISITRSDANSAKAPAAGNKTGTSQGNAAGKSVAGTYEDRIKKEINSLWNLPDFESKKLKTVVAVKILKDGTLFVQGIETSSGNRFFDKQALKTIAMASPVSPPPYEMEIGFIFDNENKR